jgi:hypothetical protein
VDASVATSSASGPICADVELQADRVIPTVILVIDQSGSMNDQFGNAGSRWNVLRDFLLLDPGGLISDLQSQVRFGLAMYSAKSDDNGHPVGECPLVSSIAPALDNYASIAQAYRAAEPIDDTPTGDAIDKIVDGLGLNMPDHVGSTALILATDGEPDRCEELDPQTPSAQQESIAAVTRAYSMGVRTFIISVGNEVGKQHQQDVANAGVGHKPGDPDAMYWEAGDDKTLRDALVQIVGSQLSCEIALNGSVEGGDACRGKVLFNSQPLICNDKDGWELVDPKHIALKGAACDRFKSADLFDLHVAFPCDVAIVQ